jgi:tetratricopeptide (TPR) repeat protein
VLSAIAQKAGSDGDLPKAIRYAQQAIEQGAISDSDYLLLDGFLARSGDLAGCIQLLQKAILVTPYSSALYERLTLRDLAAGKTDDGSATLERGLKLFPEDSAVRDLHQESEADALVQQGTTELKRGNSQAPMDTFRASMQTNPANAVAHDYIGVILAESGSLTEAMAEFQKAARLDHSLAEPHFHLGLAASRMGKAADAIAEYQEALRLNPKMPEAAYSLSAMCARQNDFDGAIVLLLRVIQSEPEFAEAHYNLGLNLWNRYKNSPGLPQKSDLEEAGRELEKATELDDRQPKMWPTSVTALSQWVLPGGTFVSMFWITCSAEFLSDASLILRP